MKLCIAIFLLVTLACVWATPLPHKDGPVKTKVTKNMGGNIPKETKHTFIGGLAGIPMAFHAPYPVNGMNPTISTER